VSAGAAALVLAHAPSAGPLGGIAGRLDPVRRAALQALLIARAARWAAAAAPGAAYVAVEPAAAAEEVAALLPEGVSLLAPRDRGDGDLTAAAIAAVGRGPLLIAGTSCVRLGPEHAAAALDDIAAGCDIVVGAELTGGWYVAALAEPRAELLAVPAVGVGTGGLAPLIARARELGAEVGMLRHERALATPADADALLADPLLPGELRTALAGPA
jgi:glycosyltransferase A (GT-A) superfamily protein (DUF2064 family)